MLFIQSKLALPIFKEFFLKFEILNHKPHAESDDS